MSAPGGGRRAAHAGAALLAALLALLPLLLGSGPFAGPLDAPLTEDADELTQHVWARTLAETGWVLRNPRLGLPDGQMLLDFPQAALSPVQVGLARLLLLVAPPGAVVNLLLVLGFPLVALSAYLALALAGARPRWALVGAVLYAATPYHFFRGTGHLFHSLYLGIPWLALACRWLLRGAPGGPAGGRGVAACLGMGLLLGGIEPYYTAYALLLIPACAGLGGWRHGRRPLGRGLALAGAILLVVGLAWWPVGAERTKRGTNQRALLRAHAESETYGLKFTAMLVPSELHRSEWMRGWARHYAAAPLHNENRFNAAGILGGLGMLGLLAALLAGGHDARRRRERGRLLVLVLLVATVGGLGSALALAGVRVVRAWNRLAILATWLGLAELVQFCDERSAGWRPGASWALAAGVLAFGAWDQVPEEPFQRRQVGEASWSARRQAWRDLEEAHPKLRRLLVLPHRTHRATTVHQYRQWAAQQALFLHTRRLAFSAGSYSERRGERWAAALASLPLDALLHRAREDGWDGLVVDHGLGPQPGPSEAWRSALEVRVPGLDAPGLGRFRVHPLGGCDEACAPDGQGVYLRAGIGVFADQGAGGALGLRMREGELILLHGGDEDRPATLRVRARSVSGEAGGLRLGVGERAPEVLELPPDSRRQATRDVSLTIPPEGLIVRLGTDLPRALEEGGHPEYGRRVMLTGTEVVEGQAAGPAIREFQ